METTVDLAFSLTGAAPLPADHGYALYGALSRLLPDLHHENGIAIHPITGRQLGDLNIYQALKRLAASTKKPAVA